MRIQQAIETVPGGLMVVPLLLGAVLNTIDQAHLAPVETVLKAIGAPKVMTGGQEREVQVDGRTVKVKVGQETHYEFLRIGGFSEALFKTGAGVLIGLFLVCSGSQMDLRVGARALKKGVLLTAAKYAAGAAAGYLMACFFDPMNGLLGLSTLAIIAATTNSNGGMYAALTEEYGSKSDVGAIALLSFNDGPVFTMLALGVMGERFPFAAFVAALVPIGLGMLLGNLDHELRTFLAPGQRLTIPFFAFALGATMDFGCFLRLDVLGAGLVLGVATVVLSAAAGVLVLRLFREKSTIAGVALASTAGNATYTPTYIAAVAASPAMAAKFGAIVETATAQITISTLTTAILCPLAFILWAKRQARRGIDLRAEKA
jgi:2-keto-3-deoxygluconate permease